MTHIATAPTAEEAAAAANDWAGTAVSVATEIMSETVNTNAEALTRDRPTRGRPAQRPLRSSPRSLRKTTAPCSPHCSTLSSSCSATRWFGKPSCRTCKPPRAKRDMLQAVLDSRTGASNQPLAAQLRPWWPLGALDSATATQLRARWRTARQRREQRAGPHAARDRTQLESLTSDLAGYVAEQALLTERLAS